MRILSFGKVTFPDIQGENDIPIGARSALQSLQNGSFDMDSFYVWLEPQQISVSFWYMENGIDTNIDALVKELLRGRNVLVAEMLGGLNNRLTFAKISSMQRAITSEAYDCYQPISITFEQNFPYWLDSADGWYLDSGVSLDTGYVLDGRYHSQTITAAVTDFTISYGGSVRSVLSELEIAPQAASAITNFTLENFTTGMVFQWTGTVAASKVLFIDFATRQVLNDNVGALGNVVTPAKQTEWMYLAPGDNVMRLTVVSITGTIDLRYKYARHYA